MSHPRSGVRRIFHYIYNTIYVLLCLILTTLILVTPGDAIRQTYFDTLQYTNIVIIAIAYLVTVLIVLFIYSLRLYVTRTVLASIPKSWIPIGKGEIKKNVREMIGKELGRSAAISWLARPKVTSVTPVSLDSGLSDIAEEGLPGNTPAKVTPKEKGFSVPSRWLQLNQASAKRNEMGILLPLTNPVWGDIEHPGWGSPESRDLANIQYSAVLSELPNLIEGKVLSLAPILPDSPEDAPLLDPAAVVALQRTGSMGMRSYVSHLSDLGVLASGKDIAEFLDIYERARFSTRPMPVMVFRRLMHLFAQLLRSAKPLEYDVLDTIRMMDGMYSESEWRSVEEDSVRVAGSHHLADIDDDAPQTTSPTTPARSIQSVDSEQSPRAIVNTNLQHPTQPPGFVARNSSGTTWARYGTAPATPGSRAGGSTPFSRNSQRARSTSRNSSIRSMASANNFAQTRQPYISSSLSSSSHGSSLRSLAQGSQGSVIRLARHDDMGDLPYVLRVSNTL